MTTENKKFFEVEILARDGGNGGFFLTQMEKGGWEVSFSRDFYGAAGVCRCSLGVFQNETRAMEYTLRLARDYDRPVGRGFLPKFPCAGNPWRITAI